MSELLLAPLSQQPVNRVHLFCRAEKEMRLLLSSLQSLQGALPIRLRLIMPLGKESLT